MRTESLPPHLRLLAAVYFVASAAHFAHNAEFIALYPNMPAWLTRDQVYLVWAAVTAVGVSGLALSRFGWHIAGAVCLAIYGAFGLAALGHYTLALCSDHTVGMNVTIWSEAVPGMLLATACGAFVVRGRRR